MHVQAIRAAVDLRRAHFHQLEQLRLQPTFVDVLLQRQYRLQRLLAEFGVIIDAHFHFGLLFVALGAIQIDVRAGAGGVQKQLRGIKIVRQFGSGIFRSSS